MPMSAVNNFPFESSLLPSLSLSLYLYTMLLLKSFFYTALISGLIRL
jgi:hypothetical protein